MRDVLGPSPNTPNNNDRYSFLPEEKRDQLRQIESDYADLMGEVNDAMAEFPLKSDREKLKYLAEEKKRDIEAMLSPAEREAMDLRTSRTANSVRSQYGSILNSEDEYKQVFALQKAFDEKYSPENRTDGERIDFKARQQDEQQLRDQIKSIVGDDRYAQLNHTQDTDLDTLNAAARRLSLPSSVTDQVLALRAQTAAQSQQIAGSQTMTPVQKTAALNTLANDTKAQIRAALGNDAADTYLQRSAPWVKSLERGASFTVTPDGTVKSSRIPGAPRTAQPAPLPAPRPKG
jgi:hypothetical protein